MASLTQLAGPPIPVMPLCGSVGDGGGTGYGVSEGTGASNGAELHGRYKAAMEQFAASYRNNSHRKNAECCNKIEPATNRPIQPGQKTLIRMPKNERLSLGISLIGGSETSLVRALFQSFTLHQHYIRRLR